MRPYLDAVPPLVLSPGLQSYQGTAPGTENSRSFVSNNIISLYLHVSDEILTYIVNEILELPLTNEAYASTLQNKRGAL